ncbi:MAG: hypothetical protein M8350_03465 [Methanosarcinaceae archaeon]|nr:hypothetical protein [Methanosarcinaceae archaeon]
MGLFNNKLESARSLSANHIIDSKHLDSKCMWDGIRSYLTRQVSAEQLVKDICSIK